MDDYRKNKLKKAMAQALFLLAAFVGSWMGLAPMLIKFGVSAEIAYSIVLVFIVLVLILVWFQDWAKKYWKFLAIGLALLLVIVYVACFIIGQSKEINELENTVTQLQEEDIKKPIPGIEETREVELENSPNELNEVNQNQNQDPEPDKPHKEKQEKYVNKELPKEKYEVDVKKEIKEEFVVKRPDYMVKGVTKFIYLGVVRDNVWKKCYFDLKKNEQVFDANDVPDIIYGSQDNEMIVYEKKDFLSNSEIVYYDITFKSADNKVSLISHQSGSYDAWVKIIVID